MTKLESVENVEISPELFSSSVEGLEGFVEKLEDVYRSIIKDPNLEEQRKDLSKTIMGIEKRIKELQN